MDTLKIASNEFMHTDNLNLCILITNLSVRIFEVFLTGIETWVQDWDWESKIGPRGDEAEIVAKIYWSYKVIQSCKNILTPTVRPKHTLYWTTWYNNNEHEW